CLYAVYAGLCRAVSKLLRQRRNRHPKRWVRVLNNSALPVRPGIGGIGTQLPGAHRKIPVKQGRKRQKTTFYRIYCCAAFYGLKLNRWFGCKPAIFLDFLLSK